jgi:chromosome segregation ATPase
MRIWRRRSGKSEQSRDAEQDKKRLASTAKHEAAQLRAALRQLLQQQQAVEQRGCFSDRELAEKDSELDQLEQRIKAIKNQQFRLRAPGKVWC